MPHFMVSKSIARVAATFTFLCLAASSSILAMSAQQPSPNASAATPPTDSGPPDLGPPPPVDSPYAKAALAVMREPLNRLTPVTDEMLRNPPPGDWLHWRRTYDGWAYSPLTQINRKNVKDLKVAWTFSMTSTDDAVVEFTPLVHDGVLFLWNFGDTIQALDAKTGTLLWQFELYVTERLPVVAGLLPDEAKPRDRRQQAHRPDDRHARNCTGHQDREEGVGCCYR